MRVLPQRKALRIIVTEDRKQLRMRRRDVVIFHEGFERHLPVARQMDGQIPAKAHPLIFISVEVFGDGFEIFSQALALLTHIDPDKPSPAIYPHRLQIDLLAIKAAIPVMLVLNQDVLALEVERPAMIAAAKGRRLAAAAGKAPAAVWAERRTGQVDATARAPGDA